MKKTLSLIFRKLGEMFFVWSDNLNRSKTRKPLYIDINKAISSEYKQHKKHVGAYISNALKIATQMIGNAPLDDNFYADYYTLKSKVDRHNNYFIPAILSIELSICTQLVFDFATQFQNCPWLDILAGILLAVMAVCVVFIVHWELYSKADSVIYPFILKKMEEKISSNIQ